MLEIETVTMHKKENQADRADMLRLKMELSVWVPNSFSVPLSPLPRGLCMHISFHAIEGRKD